jgi:16S rRNA processing protein RimM
MAQIQDHDLLAVAHILQPHHLHGEVCALQNIPDFLDFANLLTGKDIHLRSPAGRVRPCSCESLRSHKNRWLVKLSGIDSRTQAGEIKGCDLCLMRADLPELPEGWFWEADLKSCRVVDDTLGEIGVVQGLDTSSTQARLIIGGMNERKFRIPWVNAFFPEVRLDEGIIRSTLPDGILDLDG